MRRRFLTLLIAAVMAMAPAVVWAEDNTEPISPDTPSTQETEAPTVEPGGDTPTTKPATDPVGEATTQNATENVAPTEEATVPTTAELPKTKPVKVTGVVGSTPRLRVIKLTWTPIANATSYEIYGATKKKGKYKFVKTVTSNYGYIYSATPGKTYYYKVRAKNSYGIGTYSAICAYKAATVVDASLTLITDADGNAFNYREAAGEELYGFDTLQGACAYGGYAYLTLFDRTCNRVKIVKMNLKTNEIVKVSGPLNLGHANGITYNTKTNRIVVAMSSHGPKIIKIVNPNTLTVESSKTVKRNISAIAYNSTKGAYVAREFKSHKFVRLGSTLSGKKLIKITKTNKMLYQDMDSHGNYVYDVQSFASGYDYNRIVVRTWAGKYVGVIKVPKGTSPGMELETVFHDGSNWYVGFYYSTSQKHDDETYRVNRVNVLYKLNNPAY